MKTQKMGIIRCGYVGWHDAQIGMSIKWHEPLHSPARERLRYTNFMRGIGPGEPVINWVDMRVDSFTKIIHQHGQNIGCFVIDAYLMSFTNVETIKEVIDICHDHDIIVVFDETKTGGRISKLGYADDHKLNVDLVVIGKALANGAPISIVIGRDDLLDYAVQARLSGTFSKEMFTIYAALVTLELMEQGSGSGSTGWEEIGQIGTKIADVITAAAIDADVREHLWAQPVFNGGMFELCYSDWILPERQLRQALLGCLADQGVLLLEGHPSFVCLAHRETDWAHFQHAVLCGLNCWKQTGEFYGR
jgi:glutamate-1-semialdehyde 2,1-aminomutase